MENETVFIVGCARTGSTLLRDLLNKSDRICLASETHFLRRMSHIGLWKRIRKFGDMSDDRNVEKLVRYLYGAIDRGEKNYWSWLIKTVDSRVFTQRLLATDRSDRAIFTLLMQLYAEQKRGVVTPDLILGEKTPTHLYYVPTLFEWYPRAKVIHTFRDPRGIFVSTLKRVQAGRWGLKALFPKLPKQLLDPLDTPSAVFHTTNAWFQAVRLHAAYARAYPARYYLVRFEDLIADPVHQVRQICAFLDVPFDSQMVAEVNIVGSSYRDQRRGPSGFDTQAVYRWKEHINPFVRGWFSVLGRKHLENFGYAP